MKGLFKIYALLIILFLLPTNIFAQATCTNEDFESSTAGVITLSTDIAGYTSKKLIYSNFQVNNCNSFTSTAATPTNPTAIEVFNGSTIDPHIGAGYPIYSVFGSGAQNGGQSFNPQISNMRGNSFVRVNATSSAINYQFHMIEKTMTVTASNALFQFAYIAVVEKGGASACCDNPSVAYRFYNVSNGNSEMNCLSSTIFPTNNFCIANSNVPLIACTSFTNLYYNPWKIVAVDLTPYIGSVIQFKMGGFYCVPGCAKLGYFYFDAQCGAMDIKVNNTILPASTNSVTFKGCGVQSATVVTPSNFSSYQWTGPAGFTSTLSSITTSAQGVYTLNINTAGTCSVITKYINVGLYPAASVSVSSSAPVLCKGQFAKIIASGLSTYSWNISSTSATLNVSPPANFSYSVSGLNADGCFGSASITQSVISCVGLNESEIHASILVYPNPGTGVFYVSHTGNEKFTMIVSNELAQIIQVYALESSVQKIEIKRATPGIYYYQIQKEGKTVSTGKLFVVNAD